MLSANAYELIVLLHKVVESRYFNTSILSLDIKVTNSDNTVRVKIIATETRQPPSFAFIKNKNYLFFIIDSWLNSKPNCTKEERGVFILTATKLAESNNIIDTRLCIKAAKNLIQNNLLDY